MESLESGIGSLSVSGGSVPLFSSRVLVSSSSVPLDLSTAVSIVAGELASPTTISDTCEFFIFLL